MSLSITLTLVLYSLPHFTSLAPTLVPRQISIRQGDSLFFISLSTLYLTSTPTTTNPHITNNSMRFSSSAVAVLLACIPASFAQTSTDCDPTNKTCPADTGLSASTYSADFTAAGSNASWTAAAYSEITYGDDGAVFTISKEG